MAADIDATGTRAAELDREWSAVAAAWEARAQSTDGQTLAATDALVGAIAPRPGDRLLELACGPGTLGERWSALVGPAGRVVLSDVARGMVEVAARRNRGLANVEVALLDASAIDLPAASFDVVAVQMGLMFTPRPAVALAEIRRVLVRGGRAGVLTWGPMERNPWITCAGMAAMDAGVEGLVPPFLPGGLFSLADAEALEALGTAAGFADVSVREVELVFQAPSVDAHVERVLSLAGPLAEAISRAPAEVRAKVRRSASDLVAPYVTADGTVTIPGVALLLTARAG